MANKVKLSPEELTAALAELPGWFGDEHGLDRKFYFADFRTAMNFMGACVDEIEARDHHPDWTNVHNHVSVHLETWDVGRRVSRRDVDLAHFLDEVAQRFDARDSNPVTS